MMTQRALKSPEYRDEQQNVPFRHRMSTKCGLFFCMFFLFICSGTWYAYHLSKQIVFAERQQRGVWIARHVVDNIRDALLEKDFARIESIIKRLELEKEITYLVIFDAAKTQIFSQYYNGSDSSWSDTIRPLICEQMEPQISGYSAGNTRFSHIGLRIVRPSSIPLTQNPVLSAKSDCLGTLHLGLSLRTADATLASLRNSNALLIGGTLVLGCIGFALLARMVIRPLGRLSLLISSIAAGDMPQTLPISSTTEIRLLEAGLANLLSSLQKFATNLKNAKEHIVATTEELLNISEEHADFHQKQIMLMYQVSQNLDDLIASSVQTASYMTSLARETESGLLAIKSSEKTIQEAISSIEEIRKYVGKNTERVALLGEKIAQIDNVVKIITTIADQTKLIAFNASIEAAGAGEAGGRFSVVATEVRRLANTVVESVEEMKNSVSAIQTSASELILSSEIGILKVDQGTDLIAEIGQTVRQRTIALDTITQGAQKIFDAFQQQQQQTASVAETVKDLANSSEQTLETTKRASDIARDLHNSVEKLVTTTQQFPT